MSLINIEKTIALDVYDHNTTPSVIKTIQMDTGARTVFAVIQNSGQAYDIGQNATVSLTVLRPDKTKVQITGQTFSYTGYGSDATAYGARADLSDVALAAKGNLKAQFKITSGAQELRTEIFTINNGEALDAGEGDWAGDLDGHNLDEMAQSIEDLSSDVTEIQEDVSDLKEGLNAITDAIIQPVAGANKLNPDTMTAGYRVANDGTIRESSTITVSDYIEVPNGVTYALGCARYNPSNPNSWSFSYGRMAFYDASKVFISPWYNSTISAVQIPTGAKYVRVDFPIAYSNMYMGFSNGASLPSYEEYGVTYENIALVRVEEVEEEVGSLDERVTALEDGTNENVAKLAIPSNYDLVVGDTFQLFFKGIVNTVYPEYYYVLVQCSKGNLYERFFEITPTTAETLTMTVTLYDSNKNLIDSKNVTLTVRNKATSPSSQKNILCVGNSLTTGGEWVTELHRRLTGTGGTPTGDGLSNINFIGTRVANNVHYEGYGGWTYNGYNTENVSNNSKVITCSHDKDQNDQHSIYQASNGSQWKLETIVTGQIKIMLVSGVSSTFPATGTLTWVSGGVNHSDIVYTASANSAGNPFWDSNANKVDFAKYATSQGVSSIDYVYVLLGWNQASQAEATFKESVQTFINNVHASFPNAKVVLLGLEVPARDGLGVNYGATSIFSRYYDLLQFVFNVDKWYADLAESNANVASVNISGQFDSIHNMITTTRQVNTRNTETEVYQSNGIHPAYSGYMQIADAVYRDITARL